MQESKPIAKKLILHPGLHKTGTTAIQAGLARHAGILKERGYSQAVIHWDLQFLHEAFNPQHYGKTRQDIDLASVRDRFRKWALHQDCETIILSGEAVTLHLWEAGGGNDEVGSYLFDGFSETTLLLYLRRQDRFFESGYYQLVKDGLAASFEEFKQAGDTDIYRVLDWHNKVGQVQSLYPDAQLLVKLYEQATAAGDIFRDFLQSIGIESIPDRVTTSRENQSLGADKIELIRVCNKHRDDACRQSLLRALQKTALPAGSENLHPPRLQSSERSRLLAHYQKSNARLFAEHGLGDLQAWEQDRSRNETDDDRVQTTDEPAALAMIDRLLAQAENDA